MVTLQCDRQSAIYLVKNQVFHGRIKHIEVCSHRIQDWVIIREVEVKKVHTDENASNFLLKLVIEGKFKHYLRLFNLKIF